MKANKSRDTTPELAFRSALHRRGLRFRKHARVIPGARVTPDVAFPSIRLAVFVDGCFWHGCPQHWYAPTRNRDFWIEKIERNQARDRANEVLLREAGWIIGRVWEHEDVEEAAGRVAKLVTSLR